MTQTQPGEDIVTGVDQILKLVNEKGEISCQEAARVLKMPKQLVQQRALTLEDEGLLFIRPSMHDMVLLSLKYNSVRPGWSFLKNFHFLKSAGKPLNEEHLKKKEEQVRDILEDVNDKIKQLKHFEKVRIEAEIEMKELSLMKCELSELREHVQKEYGRLEKQRKSFSKREAEFSQKLSVLMQKLGDYSDYQKNRLDKQKAVESALSSFANEARRVEKEARPVSAEPEQQPLFVEQLKQNGKKTAQEQA
jgi:hypothetical protein